MMLRLNIALIITLLCLTFYAHVQYIKAESWKTRHDQVLQVALRDSALVLHYRNALGQEVAKSEVLFLNLKDAQKLSHSPKLAFARQFPLVKKNLKNLKETLQVDAFLNFQTKLRLKDTTLLVGRDTIKTKQWSFSDSFNHLKGRIDGDSVTVEGLVEVPLKGVVYWQRKRHFIFKRLTFGKKIFHTELISPNPLVRISSVELIEIKRQK